MSRCARVILIANEPYECDADDDSSIHSGHAANDPELPGEVLCGTMACHSFEAKCTTPHRVQTDRRVCAQDNAAG